MSAPLILIAGTWGKGMGRNADWWRPGSEFARMLAEGGLQLADGNEPFVWSTALDGVDGLNTDWETAAWALKWYIEARCKKVRPSIIAHSHAGQVVAYAASFGARFDRVVTVATPVRQDMDSSYTQLRRACQYWAHVWTDEQQGGGWQRWGNWGLRRGGQVFTGTMPAAHFNHHEPGRSHRDLVAIAGLWKPAPDGQGWRDRFLVAG